MSIGSDIFPTYNLCKCAEKNARQNEYLVELMLKYSIVNVQKRWQVIWQKICQIDMKNTIFSFTFSATSSGKMQKSEEKLRLQRNDFQQNVSSALGQILHWCDPGLRGWPTSSQTGSHLILSILLEPFQEKQAPTSPVVYERCAVWQPCDNGGFLLPWRLGEANVY